jgi:hypothetical protein
MRPRKPWFRADRDAWYAIESHKGPRRKNSGRRYERWSRHSSIVGPDGRIVTGFPTNAPKTCTTIPRLKDDCVVLTASALNDVQEFVDVDEYGLALETLCDILFEGQTVVEGTAIQLIKDLRDLMQLESTSISRVLNRMTHGLQ